MAGRRRERKQEKERNAHTHTRGGGERGGERGVTSRLPAFLSCSGTFAPLLAEEEEEETLTHSLTQFLSVLLPWLSEGGWTAQHGKRKDRKSLKGCFFIFIPFRMNNSFLNMASIGEFDPLNASIPATKVEITVSCR